MAHSGADLFSILPRNRHVRRTAVTQSVSAGHSRTASLVTGQFALTNTSVRCVIGHTPGPNVTCQTKALPTAPPPSNRGPTSLEHASRMPATSPIRVQVLEHFLSGYDDTEKQYLLEGFRHGFSLNYGGDQIGGVFKNHPSVIHNEEIVSNKLKAWLTFLAEFNGQYIFINQRWLSSDKIKLFTDSAGSLGYAAVYGSSWVNGSWPTTWHKFNITLLELYPIMLALEFWGSRLANHAVLFLCDNEAVVHIINKQSSKEPNIMVLVRRLVLSALKFNILFKAKHIPGKHNNIADRLSRFQVNEARCLAPWLAKNPVVPPHHLLPSSIL